MNRIILASKSPRRRELIRLITEDVLCLSSTCEESVPQGMKSDYIPCHLALQKARSVSRDFPDDYVIGSDTVVILGEEILLKPKSREDAFMKLSALSGKVHRVITGCAIVKGGRECVFSAETQVEFYPLSDREIEKYIETGEPMDKAGAYGIQGKGSLFVKEIRGDYFNVVGLPVAMLKRKLEEMMLRDIATK